jgi:hypothetical protein
MDTAGPPVFGWSLKAGGVGLTVTVADTSYSTTRGEIRHSSANKLSTGHIASARRAR